VYARWGGLVLDVKGDFIDFVLYCFKLTGRPLEDLVIIDPLVDLVRYNPLDPSDRLTFGERGAAKLAAVAKLLGGKAAANEKYWDETSKSVIASVLRTLQVLRDTSTISLADVGRYARDDMMIQALVGETQERLARDRYRLTEEEYFGYLDSLEKLRIEWLGLSDNTKSILKTTISQMLGSIVSSAVLQRVFCRESAFSFKQVITEGKVVLFRGGALDPSTQKLITVCLKSDFQMWSKRRNGSEKANWGLDREGADRTILFVCDEYQEFVTGGAGGDEEFYGVSRSCKVCAIVATQHVTSLSNVLGGEDQTSTLMNNLCTKVFLNSPDPKTAKLGAHLGAKYEREVLKKSVTGGSVFARAESGGSMSVDKQLVDIFREDQFSNLYTIDMEKSAVPPWYSEAIVYHYNSFEKGPTKMFTTRLWHCYAPRDYMTELSMAYNVLLHDRNAQRRITVAYLGAQVYAQQLREDKVKEFADNMKQAEQALAESSGLVKTPEELEDPPVYMEQLKAEASKLEAEMEGASPEVRNTMALRLGQLQYAINALRLRGLIVKDSGEVLDGLDSGVFANPVYKDEDIDPDAVISEESRLRLMERLRSAQKNLEEYADLPPGDEYSDDDDDEFSDDKSSGDDIPADDGIPEEDEYSGGDSHDDPDPFGDNWADEGGMVSGPTHLN
jgi:hypothetical protein